MDSRLRSRPALLLITAALLVSLVLGATFITLHRLKDLRGEAVEALERTLTDDQSRRQVLDSAREFVAAARLPAATGSYLLASCRQNNEPPYQGTVYLEFDVPAVARTPAFFREVARSMVGRGWTEGLAPLRHPGGKVLAREGVTALLYRNPDIPGRGVLRISGACRNISDHRLDSIGFIDITGELRA